MTPRRDFITIPLLIFHTPNVIWMRMIRSETPYFTQQNTRAEKQKLKTKKLSTKNKQMVV